VQSDKQFIAQPTRLKHHASMAMVEEVEAAVDP
jgi:hypothetical protein